jgi:hypothetical protein
MPLKVRHQTHNCKRPQERSRQLPAAAAVLLNPAVAPHHCSAVLRCSTPSVYARPLALRLQANPPGVSSVKIGAISCAWGAMQELPCLVGLPPSPCSGLAGLHASACLQASATLTDVPHLCERLGPAAAASPPSAVKYCTTHCNKPIPVNRGMTARPWWMLSHCQQVPRQQPPWGPAATRCTIKWLCTYHPVVLSCDCYVPVPIMHQA